MNVSAYILVGLGGAIGSMARYWLSGISAARWGEAFPWGTLLVNVTGSLAIGFFATLTGPEGRWVIGPGLRVQFVMLGILGGYTTFSSFSLQTLYLMQNDEWGRAMLNSGLSLFACLSAVWLGHSLAGVINR